jgi:hypothetical protein
MGLSAAPSYQGKPTCDVGRQINSVEGSDCTTRSSTTYSTNASSRKLSSVAVRIMPSVLSANRHSRLYVLRGINHLRIVASAALHSCTCVAAFPVAVSWSCRCLRRYLMVAPPADASLGLNQPTLFSRSPPCVMIPQQRATKQSIRSAELRPEY